MILQDGMLLLPRHRYEAIIASSAAARGTFLTLIVGVVAIVSAGVVAHVAHGQLVEATRYYKQVESFITEFGELRSEYEPVREKYFAIGDTMDSSDTRITPFFTIMERATPRSASVTELIWNASKDGNQGVAYAEVKIYVERGSLGEEPLNALRTNFLTAAEQIGQQMEVQEVRELQEAKGYPDIPGNIYYLMIRIDGRPVPPQPGTGI